MNCLIHVNREATPFVCWPDSDHPITFFFCAACSERWAKAGIPLVSTSPERADGSPAPSGVAEHNVTPESAVFQG